VRARTFLALILLAFTAPAAAQVPVASAEAALAIADGKWIELEPGLSSLEARTATRVRLTALRIDQKRFRLAPIAQQKPDGETAAEFCNRAGAVLAVNGGFFGERDWRKGLYPVGYLRIDGKATGRNWKDAGGYILFNDEGLRIAPAAVTPPGAPETILQSKPLMIAPGGIWAMNTNQPPARPRTALCALPDSSEILLLVVHGAGLTLYETAWLMRSREEGGAFGCDAALALDGGSSTQLHVADRPELAVEGETAVHNALLALRR